MKQVRETNAGQSISAFIIMKGKKQVAKVQVHYGNSRVQVDVWDYVKCEGVQQKTAGGYGYDKATSALSGMIIDGITLNNHCGTDKRTERILKAYTEGKITLEEAEIKAKKIGANFANWSTFYDGVESYNFEGDKSKAETSSRYTSLFLLSGLDKLQALGYGVLQAI